jgi:drug/metabolite transporter (DMT)-like permease
LMLAAMALIPLGDAFGQMLMGDYGASSFFVGWSRFLIGAVATYLVFWRDGNPPDMRGFTDWRLWMRGALIAGTVSAIVAGLKTEPLANVFGAFFVGPILSYFLSAWLLKEPMSVVRTVLLIVGFCGVLLVVRPGFGMTPGLGLAALAGVFYGCYLTASRWLRDQASAPTLLFSQLVVATLILTPFGAFGWPEVTGTSGLWILCSALSSALGNYLLILAYKQAAAGRLAPFVYFQLAAAMVWGVLFFGTFPDGLALLGLLVLMITGFATIFARR